MFYCLLFMVHARTAHMSLQARGSTEERKARGSTEERKEICEILIYIITSSSISGFFVEKL